jgi:hypothetical protein
MNALRDRQNAAHQLAKAAGLDVVLPRKLRASGSRS